MKFRSNISDLRVLDYVFQATFIEKQCLFSGSTVFYELQKWVELFDSHYKNVEEELTKSGSNKHCTQSFRCYQNMQQI